MKDAEKVRQKHLRYRKGHVRVQVWLAAGTARKLERIARRWEVSKSDALRAMIEREAE